MGYTHYISNKPEFTSDQLEILTKRVKELLSKTKTPVAGPAGNKGTKPVFTSTQIMFNGVGEDAHETASVTKGAMDFDFCKTAQKPYDSLVVKFYKIIREVAPSTELSSDGGKEIFG